MRQIATNNLRNFLFFIIFAKTNPRHYYYSWLNDPRLVRIRRQSGLLTPEDVTDALEHELRVEELHNLIRRHWENRALKELPFWETIAFPFKNNGSQDGDLSISK